MQFEAPLGEVVRELCMLQVQLLLRGTSIGSHAGPKEESTQKLEPAFIVK